MRKAEKVHIDDLRSKAMTPIFTPENALNDAAKIPQMREARRSEMDYCEPTPNSIWENRADFNRRFGGDGGGMTLAKDKDDPNGPGCW